MVVLFPPYANRAIFNLLLLLRAGLGGSGRRQVAGTAQHCLHPCSVVIPPWGWGSPDSVRSARGTGGSSGPVPWAPSCVIRLCSCPLASDCSQLLLLWILLSYQHSCFPLARLWISCESPEIGRVWCSPCARSAAQHRKRSEGLAGCWGNKWLWTSFWIVNSCSF